MTADRWEQVMALFVRAVNYPPGAQQAYLQEACRDPEVRGQVEKLLADHARAEGDPFLGPLPIDDLLGNSFVSGQTRTYNFGTAVPEELPDILPNFGHYSQIEYLAAGGMGVVYKAFDRSLDRWVALKLSRPGRQPAAEDVRRIHREVRTLAKCDHPNIVRVHSVGHYDGHPCFSNQTYFTMNLVQGVGLDQCLATFIEAPRMAAGLLVKVARAVAHAHNHGVMHRDLKPKNILLDHEGEPQVTDFGLAKQVVPDGGQESPPPCPSGEASQESQGMYGTPSYMSPEQVDLTQEVTFKSDVYGLGAVLYEVLTGRPPHKGVTLQETLQQVRAAAPTPPRRLNAHVPRDLEAICLKCLAKNPDQRYATAAAVADDLEHYLARQPVHARPVWFNERLGKWARRRPGGAALVGLTFLALVGLLTVILVARDQKQRQLAGERHLRYAAEMQLAWNARKLGHAEKVRRLLERNVPSPGEEDLRGFEWYHLWRWCHDDVFSLRDHDAPVYGLAFAPDGDTLATASADGVIHLWDATTGESKGHWQGHGKIIFALAFSPDGKALVSGGADGQVKRWDLNGNIIGAPFDIDADITGLAYSPDAQKLAVSSHLGTVTLLKVKNWKRERVLEQDVLGKDPWLVSVAFAPDGRHVAAGDVKGTVFVWDLWTEQTRIKPVLSKPLHDDWVWSVAFSPHRNLLASGSFDNKVVLLDLGTGEPDDPIHGKNREGLSVCFSPDGEQLAIGGREGTILIWDVGKREAIDTIPGHSSLINGICFSPNGRTLASASADTTVNLWSLPTEERPTCRFVGKKGPVAPSRVELLGATGPLHAAVFAADGEWIVSGGKGADHRGELLIWHSTTGELLHRAAAVGGAINDLAFDPRHQRFAAAVDDGTVLVWDLRSPNRPLPEPRKLRGQDGHTGSVTSVAFRGDGTLLASGALDRTVKLWNLRTEECLRTLEHSDGVRSVAFRQDGDLFALSADTTITLYDMQRVLDASIETTLKGHRDWVNGLTFSPDGNTLASVGDDLLVKVWDVRQRSLIQTLEGHNGFVWAATFTPDGETLATAGDDLAVNLWDLSIGQPRIRMDGHTRLIRAVAFDKQQTMMITAGEDGKVLLWRAATKDQAGPGGK